MSEPTAFPIDDGVSRLVLDPSVYRLTAVKKAAYRLASRFTAVIESQSATAIHLTLAFKPGTKESVASEAVRAFYQELLDQELREEVAQETGPMRALILAQAFSKTDLIKRG